MFEEESAAAIAAAENEGLVTPSASLQSSCQKPGYVLVAENPEQCLTLERFIKERARQDRKFGKNNDTTEAKWFLILGEEVGEVANALLEMDFGKKTMEDLEEEIVQVGAVALKWLEALERRKKSAKLQDRKLLDPAKS